MSIIEFDLHGTKVRFEGPKGRGVTAPKGRGVTAKSGKIDELVVRASATLEEVAAATAKLVDVFAKKVASSVDSIEVELGIKLEGEAGFIFVNSKAEASLTVKAIVNTKGT